MRVLVAVIVCAGLGGACAPPLPIAAHAWQRQPAPLRRAGEAKDGSVEIVIADPDVVVDDAGVWHAYFHGSRAPSYLSPNQALMIRSGTSPNGSEWNFNPDPALLGGGEGTWDHLNTETPSVAVIASAPADRRFWMVYSGASVRDARGIPNYQIGLAFSADGVHFSRLPAAESPHSEAGLLISGRDLYEDADGLAGVADPELVVDHDGGVHVFCSSFAFHSDGSVAAFGVAHFALRDGRWSPVGHGPIPGLPQGGGQQPSVSFDHTLNRWEMVLTADTDDERRAVPSVFAPTLGVWRAVSSDLVTWSVPDASRTFVWAPDEEDEAVGLLTGADQVIVGDRRYLFYTGFGIRDVPEGFLVPTRWWPKRGVLNLLLATR